VFRATLEKLLDLPIVGDVRGEGYFFGIELVKDKATKETFDEAENERLLRGFLSGALFDGGLYCRADDRGDPMIQLAPPLIADPAVLRPRRPDVRRAPGGRPGPLPGPRPGRLHPLLGRAARHPAGLARRGGVHARRGRLGGWLRRRRGGDVQPGGPHPSPS
jgi:hypothetical protein